MEIPIGIYEKALPTQISWLERLELAAEIGFDFVEISIDESDERLSRLEWDATKRSELRAAIEAARMPLLDMCLSAHRKYALGSADEQVRGQALDIFHKAIDFAADVGIRIIQLAGYFVYYEEEDNQTRERYARGLEIGLRHAEKAGVMLALENVDGIHVNSVSRAMDFVRQFDSPWFQIYPDIGNLSEQGLDVCHELELGRGHFVAVHLKDVKKGQVRRIPFGQGIVDFDAALHKLVEIDYTGPFLIEMWNDNAPDAIDTVRNSLQFVRDKMALNGLAS